MTSAHAVRPQVRLIPIIMPTLESAPRTFAAFEGKAEGNKIIGVSLIQEGPAIGHGEFVDATTLQQTLALAQKKKRLKSKLDHWSRVSETVGYFDNFRIQGGKLLGDFNFFSHPSKARLLEMIESIPTEFGVSIVFGAAPPESDSNGNPLTRVAALHSADFVDFPAANRDGLFNVGRLHQPEEYKTFGRHNLYDLVSLANATDEIKGIIAEAHRATPEFEHLPTRKIKGASYRGLYRESAPVTGFLHGSEGIDASKSAFAARRFSCALVGGRVEILSTMLDSVEGVTAEEIRQLEAAGVLESALRTMGRQIFDGTAASEKGFPGLKDMVDPSMEVNAGGTAAATGSSVYLVKTGPRNVQLLSGNDGLLRMNGWRVSSIELPDGKIAQGEISDLACWVGLQCTNPRSVARIKNLTEQTGKGLTPALLNRAIEAFPGGAGPDVLFMTPRSLRQLRDAAPELAAVLHSNKPMYAGLPICATDSISNAEVIG